MYFIDMGDPPLAILVLTLLAYSSLHFSGGTRTTVLLFIRNWHNTLPFFLSFSPIINPPSYLATGFHLPLHECPACFHIHHSSGHR